MLRVVLVRPAQPRNIGAVLRAAANFAADSVHLVAPVQWDAEAQREARVAASGAWELVQLQVHADLESAVSGCHTVVGTSARTRSHPASPVTLANFFSSSSTGPIALVFGPESQGLTADELNRCHALVTIPTDPQFASLNLAQSVLLVLYEASRSKVDGSGSDAPNLATSAEQEALIQSLADPSEPAQSRAAAQLRHWFHRAAPATEELAALRLLLNLKR